MPVAIGSVAPQDHDVPAASILDLARTMSGISPFADPRGRRCSALVGASDARPDRAAPDGDGRRRPDPRALPGPTMIGVRGSPVGRRPEPRDHRRARATRASATRADRRRLSDRGRAAWDQPARLAGRGSSPSASPRRSGSAADARPRPPSSTSLILDTGLPAPRDVAAAVYERTDGIPLHIEELLGALSAEARADGSADPRCAGPRHDRRCRPRSDGLPLERGPGRPRARAP